MATDNPTRKPRKIKVEKAPEAGARPVGYVGDVNTNYVSFNMPRTHILDPGTLGRVSFEPAPRFAGTSPLEARHHVVTDTSVSQFSAHEADADGPPPGYHERVLEAVAARRATIAIERMACTVGAIHPRTLGTLLRMLTPTEFSNLLNDMCSASRNPDGSPPVQVTQGRREVFVGNQLTVGYNIVLTFQVGDQRLDRVLHVEQ